MRSTHLPEDSPARPEASAEPAVSVVVPVYREGEGINGFLADLLGTATAVPFEILVVDGDEGSTLEHIRPDLLARIRPLQAPKGRARQMNIGAARARGRVLLFLHADARLPLGAFDSIVECLGKGGNVAGAFDLAIDSPRPMLRLIARMASLRSRLTRIPYGDQAQFITRSAFRSLDGFRNWPFMEDVDLMSRLKARRERIDILAYPVKVSARRWEKEGAIACTLRNWGLLILYLLGAPPGALSAFYLPHNGSLLQREQTP